MYPVALFQVYPQSRFTMQNVRIYRRTLFGDLRVEVESFAGQVDEPIRVDEGLLHKLAATLHRLNPDIASQIEYELSRANPAVKQEVLADLIIPEVA